MQNTSDSQKLEVLCAVLADIETFPEIDAIVLQGNDRFVRSMLKKGVPFTPSTWIRNAVFSAHKMDFTRAVRKLEMDGALTRLTEPKRDRTTHVIPTASAIATITRRLGSRVDRGAVLRGLRRTIWGTSIANELERLWAADTA